MFISFLNIIKKTIYVIFSLAFLSIISSDYSLGSSHTLTVEELEISNCSTANIWLDAKELSNEIIDKNIKVKII